jgi:hypothetical protein
MAWGALVVLAGVITITVPQSAITDLANRFKRSLGWRVAGQGTGFASCPEGK